MCSELYSPLKQYPGLKGPSRNEIVRFPLLFSVDLCQHDKLSICTTFCGM